MKKQRSTAEGKVNGKFATAVLFARGFFTLHFSLIVVELEGIEPSSKQGRPVLSTRLFQPLFFVQQQDLDHQSLP